MFEQTQEIVTRLEGALEVVNARYSPDTATGGDLVERVLIRYASNKDTRSNGPHTATIAANLQSSDTRNVTADEVLSAWQGEAGPLPDVSQSNFAQSAGTPGAAIWTFSGSIAAGTADSWSFGPELKLPVLSQGTLQAKRDQAIAAAKETEINRRASVLKAVEGVEVAASDLSANRRKVGLLRKSVAAQEKPLDLSQNVFADGALDLLNLLDAERATLSAKTSLAQSVHDVASAWVELQIATGRGCNV